MTLQAAQNVASEALGFLFFCWVDPLGNCGGQCPKDRGAASMFGLRHRSGVTRN